MYKNYNVLLTASSQSPQSYVAISGFCKPQMLKFVRVVRIVTFS